MANERENAEGSSELTTAKAESLFWAFYPSVGNLKNLSTIFEHDNGVHLDSRITVTAAADVEAIEVSIESGIEGGSCILDRGQEAALRDALTAHLGESVSESVRNCALASADPDDLRAVRDMLTDHLVRTEAAEQRGPGDDDEWTRMIAAYDAAKSFVAFETKLAVPSGHLNMARWLRDELTRVLGDTGADLGIR